MSKKRSFIFKTAFSIVFLAIIFYHIDLKKIYSILAEVDLIFVYLTIVINVAGVFVSVLKWNLFLNTQRIFKSIHRLHTLYYIGFFFNNFLPSMVGGDYIRIVNTSGDKGLPNAFSAVFCERITGLIAMFFLAGAAAVWNLYREVPVGVTWLAIISLLAIGCISGVVSLIALLHSKISNLRFKHSWAMSVHNIMDAIAENLKYQNVLVKSFMLSVIFHMLLIINGYFFAKSIGLDLDIIILAVIFPVSMLAAMIPISLNGLGIKEGSLMVLLGQIGVTVESALVIAFLSRLFIIIGSGIGWILFLIQKENILTKSTVLQDDQTCTINK